MSAAPPPLRAPNGPSPGPPAPLRPQAQYPNPSSHPTYSQPSMYPPPTKSTKETPAVAFAESAQQYNRKFQGFLDRVTPYSTYRWMATAGLLVIFALRVVFGQGWYIVAYGLSIFLLNIFLAFLQPKFDPSLEQDLNEQDVEEGGEAGSLPTHRTSDLPSLGLGGKFMGMLGVNGGASSNGGGGSRGEDGEEDFRPFIRRLPEFKFWLQATRATVISLALTLTRAADIPVYWPILLIYFLTLFGLTMRRQLRHMIKYKYIPFDMGRKATYNSKK
ncbi:Rer1 family-domain-containing protein [Mrakia frigida]|uniref:protein retrieval receptor n=1 Tax=Mrakia frigida TaxID=29902 RepID=UPI003FCC0390